MVSWLIRCLGLEVSALRPCTEPPQPFLKPMGLRTSGAVLTHLPERPALPEESKCCLTSNHGCCNHMIFAKLPNYVYLADTVWNFLNTSLTYEEGCPAKDAIQFFLFYYYFKYIYILNLDDNRNQKANVKTGFLVWIGFVQIRLFVSGFYCRFFGVI